MLYTGSGVEIAGHNAPLIVIGSAEGRPARHGHPGSLVETACPDKALIKGDPHDIADRIHKEWSLKADASHPAVGCPEEPANLTGGGGRVTDDGIVVIDGGRDAPGAAKRTKIASYPMRRIIPEGVRVAGSCGSLA